MLDKPEKTIRLLSALKSAVPFEVRLTTHLIQHLEAEDMNIDVQTRQIVSELSYAGDEGGIVCHISSPDREEALIVSLTHVRVPRTLPFAAAVADYQKRRIKKLRKQGRA